MSARPSTRSSIIWIAARRSPFARRCSKARAGGIRPSKRPATRTLFASSYCPKAMDPMDIRYNVIQWVHRSTRGWSYGAPVSDPRTGEIIKGKVTLGSLRARQDYLIAEALLAPYENGQTGTRTLCSEWCWRACASSRRMRWDTLWVWHTTTSRAPQNECVRDGLSASLGGARCRTVILISRMPILAASANGTKSRLRTAIRTFLAARPMKRGARDES